MKRLIILNPWANRGGARRQKKALTQLCQQHGFHLVVTTRAGEATQLAYQAAQDGMQMVVAAGGDGTVHEVVNGLYKHPKPRPVLGVLPIGSGNDMAYGLGIPMKLETAVQRLLTGTPCPIDLAHIEDEHGRSRLADNNIGIGFDAQVVIETEAINWSGGFFLYLYATFRTLYHHFHPYSFSAHFDQEHVAQEALFVAFGLGPRSGGGFLFTPKASNIDNLIDSCWVKPMNRLRAITLLPSAMTGNHVNSPLVTIRQNSQIIVQSTRPMPIHVDGEIFAYPHDNVKKVTIRTIPAAIEVIS